MPPVDPAAVAHAGVVPDEVLRLRLEPGETLIVRVADRYSPGQMRDYASWLEEAFPDFPVRVVMGEQILVARAQEAGDG